MEEIKFNACKNLDFDPSHYSAKLALIHSRGLTKGVWERRDLDKNIQFCQFCKKNGRHNRAESCLDSEKAECGDYEDYEHVINTEEIDPRKEQR